MIKLIVKLTGMTLTWDYSDELAIKVSQFTLVKTLCSANKFSVKLGQSLSRVKVQYWFELRLEGT